MSKIFTPRSLKRYKPQLVDLYQNILKLQPPYSAYRNSILFGVQGPLEPACKRIDGESTPDIWPEISFYDIIKLLISRISLDSIAIGTSTYLESSFRLCCLVWSWEDYISVARRRRRKEKLLVVMNTIKSDICFLHILFLKTLLVISRLLMFVVNFKFSRAFQEGDLFFVLQFFSDMGWLLIFLSEVSVRHS